MSKTFGEHPRPSIATAVWTPTRLALVMSALAVLLVLAGLAAGSEGLSFAWQDNGWVIGAIRAPRTLGALCAGGLLGLSGAIAQGVFRNPLADPYLLGSASGATLAIVLTLAAGSAVGVPVALLGGDWLVRIGLVGAAFVGALFGVLLTLTLAGSTRSPTTLLLAGVVVGVLLGAISNLMMLISPEALRGAQMFLLGTTGFLGWTSLAPLIASLVVALPLAIRFARVLDALVLGEDTATTLGIPVPAIRLLLILLIALATGTAVAETGLVAFVGLVAPHIVRRTLIVTHGTLLALSTLVGGVLLLAADVLARTLLAPQELPVGLLTAVVGGAYLLVLLRRKHVAEYSA